jgi:hypothetical protein
MSHFIGEDDLKTFDGWLRYQGIDPATAPHDELAEWQKLFAEIRRKPNPKVSLMKLRPIPGEYRYAVAIREGSDLWLTLWARRSPKPEFFVMQPRSDRGWDPHVSFHFNGKLHFKSHGRVVLKKERQPLSDTFRGTVHLGGHGGHGKSAICDRKAFNGVVEVESDVLDPRHGQVVVDLVEPGCKPMPWPFVLVRRKTFKHRKPWVVIRIGRDINDPLPAFSWRLSLFFVKVFVARWRSAARRRDHVAK